MINTKMFHSAVIAGCLFGLTQMATAAPITWIADGNFHNENDIDMAGTLVRAEHSSRTTGGSAFSTNNFVVTNAYGILDFKPMGADAYDADITSPDSSVVSTNMSGIFGRDDIFTNDGTASETFDAAMDCTIYSSFQIELVLSNLTVGVEYKVQLFRDASNGSAASENYCYFSDTEGFMQGNLSSTNIVSAAATATGTFMADATTQSVFMQNTGVLTLGTDPSVEPNTKANFNAYVLLKEPFVLPDPLPQPGDPLLPFSISTNSVINSVTDIITFPSQLYHDYTLWGSSDLTVGWVALTATNGIPGIHKAEVSVTNAPAGSPYFYKVTGE